MVVVALGHRDRRRPRRHDLPADLTASPVIVIGAGMAGLSFAAGRRRAGDAVVVLDKGRAVGGRMATRSRDGARFDHGAQHFSARSPGFAEKVQSWLDDDVVGVWFASQSLTEPDRGVEPRHVPVGGMRRLPEHLAEGLDVITGVRVDRLDRTEDAVVAVADGVPVARGRAAVVTPPLPQTLDLLDASGIQVPDRHRLEAIEYDACLAVMARLDGDPGLPDGHLAPEEGDIAWIADNRHKGTSPTPAVTIHSTAEFAERHLDAPLDAWVPRLLDAATSLLHGRVLDAVGHRWHFSRPRTTLGDGAILASGDGAPVVLAGEAFAGARVEGAWLSGRAAAELIEGLTSAT